MNTQITKEEFRRTEGLLYKYFEQPQQVDGIKKHIEVLKKQIQELDKRIHETDVSLDTYTNMGIDYSRDKVQASSQGSYAEQETCRQIQKLEDMKLAKNNRINELLIQIQEIEENNQVIHDNLNMLSGEMLQMIDAKYKKKLGIESIIEQLHMSRSTWFDKRSKLIENIAQWFELIKYK